MEKKKKHLPAQVSEDDIIVKVQNQETLHECKLDFMCKPQMDPYLNKLIHKIVVVVLSFGSLLTFGYEGKTPFII